MIRRMLVANRGEIARRIFATCRRMGIATVAVYSDPDASAAHVRDADVAVRLPGSMPADTYLRGDLIVAAARDSGADAVHPGYGFLAENADFATMVLDAGLTWVGPPPKVIGVMGSKLEAKSLLREAGVPTLPSWTEPDQVAEFPVLVKASAGGGGRGMRIVREAAELAEAMAAASREATAAFGDGTVFCERYVETGRHVEVQVFGDVHGTVVALGERECSIQRRHQKILEESPSPAVDDQMRAAFCEAAVAAARAVGYVGAGTVEFLLANDGRFYFLEMNTRLQVEHPVTECVLGLDLVRLQVHVAEGRPLPFTEAPPMRGHAIEVRLYAEDPANDWRPSIGTLHRFAITADAEFTPPTAAGVRVDSGVADGSAVTIHYDPMLAKVVAWAPTREEAVRTLESALTRAAIHGVVTNRDLLVRVLRSPEFLSGETDTAFLDRSPEVFEPLIDSTEDQRLMCLAAAVTGAAGRRTAAAWRGLPSGWRNVASAPQLATFAAPWGRVDVQYTLAPGGRSVRWCTRENAEAEDAEVETDITHLAETEVFLDSAGITRRFTVHTVADTSYVDSTTGSATLVEVPRFSSPATERLAGSLVAPMPGSVGRVVVTAGQPVAAGDLLLTLEAMKLEYPVHAPETGIVTELRVEPGSQVEAGAVLAVVTPQEPVADVDEEWKS